MEKEVDMEKNIMRIEKYYLKENIWKEQEMDMEKNIMKLEN